MPFNRRNNLYAILFGSLLFYSCSQEQTQPPTVTPDQAIAEGWQKFAARQYQEALNKFNQAITMDANKIDAYNGAGWSNARLNLLSASLTSFVPGFSRDTSNLQIKAGLAIVYNAQKSYQLSIDRGLSVLRSDSNWIFNRDTAVNFSDLRILLAQDYYALATYSASLDQLRHLEPSFSADVSTAAGQAALGQEIERLRALY